MARPAHCLVAAALALAGCRRVEEPLQERRSPAASPSAITVPTPAPAPASTVTELLRAPGSAYGASLFVDDEAVELLTDSVAYRLVPGQAPVRRLLELGFSATATHQDYVYWSKGALWSAKRVGPGAPQRLAFVALPPQRLVASGAGKELAWLEHSDGNYAIAKLANRRAERLYRSPGSIDAVALLRGAVFFIERPSSRDWRVGRVALAGGPATFTAERPGRWPAMLAGDEELVFYDGNRRAVIALSLDLQRERTLVQDFICSPWAVAAHVYCANVDGVYELSSSGEPRPIVAGTRHAVASLAASNGRLAFVSDVGERGQDQLAVSVVTLGH